VLSENAPQVYKVDSGLIGAGGKRTFHYLVSSKGSITLGFVYRRSWEKKPPIKTFQVFITAK